MAERRGSRVIFFSPAKESCDRRGRVRTCAPGKQALDHRPHGLGAEHECFLASAAIEHAVGEDMAAFQIGAELDFIDSKEGDVEIARHRFDSRHPITRMRRLDLLLAGDKRDRLGAYACRDLVVDLARQQPERQPDDA